jgi:serine/threonine protein kinase
MDGLDRGPDLHLHHFTTENERWKIKRLELSALLIGSSLVYKGQASTTDKDRNDYEDEKKHVCKFPCKVKRFLSTDSDLFTELDVLRACCRVESPGYLCGKLPLYLGSKEKDDGYTCVAISTDPRPDLDLHKSVPLMDLFGLGKSEALAHDCYPQPLAKSVKIALEIYEGLHYLHSNGFVLTNMNPRNICISESNRFKLSSSGIGKYEVREMEEHFDHIMLTGFENAVSINSVGTARCFEYAAPELYSGEGVCEKTDSFGAMALLLLLLTGSPPFVGSKEYCEDSCMNLDLDNSYERLFLRRLTDIFPDNLLNNCGLDGPNVMGRNGLRHLMYNGLRANKLRRWGPTSIKCELLKLLKYLETAEKV